nr:hypothetical protein [uncultured Macellibacteroides sp.]
MNTKFSVGTTVRSRFLEDQDIVSIIGDRIYPVVAPKGASGDFIVYVRDSYSKQRNGMGHTEECGLYVVCCSKSYDSSVELAERVNAICEEFSAPGIRRMELADSSEEFESDIYMQILLFNII